jgi:GNAT superfamily N-acetyltransferase
MIQAASTDAQIQSCFPVMRQLRTHLVESEFVPRVRLQARGGYELAFLVDGERVVAVAGFRIIENLSAGRVLYVDDLVTDEAHRSAGHGKQLLDWLAERGRAAGCAKLDLDSGVQRVDAHRFYLANGMAKYAHHFRMEL